MNKDLEHLRLLSIFHYVVGGLTALFACLPLIHLTLGLFFLFAPLPENPQKPNEAEFLRLFGVMFVVIPTIIIALGWTLAICIIVAGRRLGKREHYTFCLVVAAAMCMIMPFGTILGVFSIIVLQRDSVKALFDNSNTVGAAGKASDWR